VSLDDARDNCTSFQPFDHYNRFGMGEENQTNLSLPRRRIRHPENLVALAPLELSH
jgi:hypothetical protein